MVEWVFAQPFVYLEHKAMAVRHGCMQWCSMIEAGLEEVEDVPAMCCQALEVARSVVSLADASKVLPSEVDYVAVSGLASGSKKSDKAYFNHKQPYQI